jgi:hypothetical protein
MTMTVTRPLMLTMVGRAGACAASIDDGLMRLFRDINVATAEVVLNSLERINLITDNRTT